MMSIQRSIKITMLSALLVMGLPILSVKAQSSVPRDAGQSSAAPTADKSFRNGMLIVGSSTLQALTEKVLGEMYRSYKLAPATVKPRYVRTRAASPPSAPKPMMPTRRCAASG